MSTIPFSQLSPTAKRTAVDQTITFMILCGCGVSKKSNEFYPAVVDYLKTTKEGSYCRYDAQGHLKDVHFSKRILFEKSFDAVLHERQLTKKWG